MSALSQTTVTAMCGFVFAVIMSTNTSLKVPHTHCYLRRNAVG